MSETRSRSLRLGFVSERRDFTGHVLDIGVGEQQEVGISRRRGGNALRHGPELACPARRGWRAANHRHPLARTAGFGCRRRLCGGPIRAAVIDHDHVERWRRSSARAASSPPCRCLRPRCAPVRLRPRAGLQARPPPRTIGTAAAALAKLARNRRAPAADRAKWREAPPPRHTRRSRRQPTPRARPERACDPARRADIIGGPVLSMLPSFITEAAAQRRGEQLIASTDTSGSPVCQA